MSEMMAVVSCMRLLDFLERHGFFGIGVTWTFLPQEVGDVGEIVGYFVPFLDLVSLFSVLRFRGVILALQAAAPVHVGVADFDVVRHAARLVDHASRVRSLMTVTCFHLSRNVGKKVTGLDQGVQGEGSKLMRRWWGRGRFQL